PSDDAFLSAKMYADKIVKDYRASMSGLESILGPFLPPIGLRASAALAKKAAERENTTYRVLDYFDPAAGKEMNDEDNRLLLQQQQQAHYEGHPASSIRAP